MSLKIIIDATKTSDAYSTNPQLFIDDVTEFLKAGHSPLTEVLYKQDIRNSLNLSDALPVFAARLDNLEVLNLLIKAGAPDPTIFVPLPPHDTLDSGHRAEGVGGGNVSGSHVDSSRVGSSHVIYNDDFYNTKLGAQLFKQAAKNWISNHPENPLPYVNMGAYDTYSVENFIIHHLDNSTMLGEILSLIPPNDKKLKERLGKYIQTKRVSAADFSLQAIQHGWMDGASAVADRAQMIRLIDTNNIDAIRSLVEMGFSLKDIKAEKDDTPFVFYATSVEMLQLLEKGGVNIKAAQYHGESYELSSISRAKNPETLQYLIDYHHSELKKDTELKLHRAIFKGVTEENQHKWQMAMVLAKNGWNVKDYDYYYVAGNKDEDRIKWCVEQGALFATGRLAKNMILSRDTKGMNQLRKWGVNVTEPGMLYGALWTGAPRNIIEYLVKKGAVANGPTPWGDYEYFGMRNMGNNQLLGLSTKDKNEWMNRKAPNGNHFLNNVLTIPVNQGSAWVKIWGSPFQPMRIGEALQDMDIFDLSAKNSLGRNLMHHVVHGEYSVRGPRLLNSREALKIAISSSVEDNAIQSVDGDTWLHILMREQPSNWDHLLSKMLSVTPEKLPLLIKNNQGHLPSEYYFGTDASQIQKIKTLAEWVQTKSPSFGGLLTLQAKYHFLEKYAAAAEKSDQPSELIFEYDPKVQDNLFRYALAKHPDKIDTNAMALFETPKPERIIDVIERMAQDGTIEPEILAGWRERHFNQISEAGKIKSVNKPKI